MNPNPDRIPRVSRWIDLPMPVHLIENQDMDTRQKVNTIWTIIKTRRHNTLLIFSCKAGAGRRKKRSSEETTQFSGGAIRGPPKKLIVSPSLIFALL
jgi:hypothetical protein